MWTMPGIISGNILKGVSVSRPQGTYMLLLDCTQWCEEHKKDDRRSTARRRGSRRDLAGRTSVPQSVRNPDESGASACARGRGI